MSEFNVVTQELRRLLEEWEPKLLLMPDDLITEHYNEQHRTIKQILGHLADSASNNTHRIVHLQYQESPLQFPNYATNGNNDKWIAIQHYQQEDWKALVNYWKYTNLHIIHVINNVDHSKLENTWQNKEDSYISLREGIMDYLRHFKLHLNEIDVLLITR